jgi:hypothetical protein
MDDTQSTGQPPLAPDAGSSNTADTGADTHRNPPATVTSKRRRGSQSTKTKTPPKARTSKKQQLSNQRFRESLQKYVLFTNLYEDYISAKEELIKKYREAAGCPAVGEM